MKSFVFQLSATLFVVGVMLVACTNAANLASDFSNDAAQPDATGWTHGFNDTTVGGGNDVANDVLFLLAKDADNPGDRWTGDASGTSAGNFPPDDLMLVNLGGGGSAGDHWGGGSITWDAGVAYHTWGRDSDPDGNNGHNGMDTIFSTYSVMADGLYDITGTWTENGNSGGATVDVLHNGVPIAASGSVDLDTDGSTATISALGVSLSTGDTVSFRTLRASGGSGDGVGGSVRLDASVTNAIPEPGTMLLSVMLAMGSLAVRRHKM